MQAEARVEAAKVDLVYGQVRLGLVVNVVNAGIWTAASWSTIPHTWMIAWFVAIIVVNFGRFLLALAYDRRSSDAKHAADSIARWRDRFVVGAAASGTLWGLAGSLLLPEQGLLFSIDLAVLLGMVAGAVPLMTSVLRAYHAFLLPLFIPLFVRLVSFGTGLHLAMAGLSAIFIAAMIGTARRIHATIDESLVLRFHNQALTAERAEADAERARIGKKHEMHVERTPVAVIEWTPERRVASWNPAAHAIFGFTRQEALGGTSELFVAPADRAAAEASFALVLEGRASTGTWRAHTKSGAVIVCEWFETPLLDDDGVVIGAASIALDVTERHALERMKGEFVGTVSHELRTPLTSIRGALGLIAGGAVGEVSPEILELVEMGAANCDRLVRLINDILDFERVRGDDVPLTRRRVDLAKLLLETVEAARGLAVEQRIELVTDTPQGGVPVIGDPDRLVQVFTNLLGNAVKFAPSGSDVHVDLEHHEGRAIVRVRDHGPGVPSSFRQHIFQPFTQADSSDRRARGGTGLGLSISKSIVERHGGTIGFESEGGEGATFWVELPAAP